MTDTYESLKKHAAREIWPKRDHNIPSKQVTWRVWWNKKFNDDLNEFAAREAK